MSVIIDHYDSEHI